MAQLQPSVMLLLKHIWNLTKLVGSCVWMIKKGRMRKYYTKTLPRTVDV